MFIRLNSFNPYHLPPTLILTVLGHCKIPSEDAFILSSGFFSDTTCPFNSATDRQDSSKSRLTMTFDKFSKRQRPPHRRLYCICRMTSFGKETISRVPIFLTQALNKLPRSSNFSQQIDATFSMKKRQQ